MLPLFPDVGRFDVDLQSPRIVGLHAASPEERRDLPEMRIETNTERMTQLANAADQGVCEVKRLRQVEVAPEAPR